MAPVRRREPAKTWSLLGEVRKKPSEYEVVTTGLHYHYNRQPAPFELDPNTPINAWYLRYREGSPFQTPSWEDFRDSHQLTYQLYVQRQSEREAYLENLVEEFECRNHDASLQADWVRELDRLCLPARFPLHALQMAALYVAQMAPSSFITNAAYFQAADELRRIQWVAYRAKSLSLEHDAELASSTHTRRRWEEDAVWQSLRETVEKMLIAYDWGEAFVALNLIVKPILDMVFNVELAELARAHDDALLGLMLDDFQLDSQRSRDWTVALCRYATAQRPANIELLEQWVDQWKPLAYQGMEALVELFGQAPRPVDPRAVSAKVRAAHDALLARCGLDAAPMTKAEFQKSGIDAIGDIVAWGAHFCLFYETKEDLLDALISYCKSGLENKEYCLWVVTEPLTIEEATVALKQAVPDLDTYLADSSVEIVSANDFFLQGGQFDRRRVAEAMSAKLAGISARGYAGVRLTGDTSWVTKKDWLPFCELEDDINEVFGSHRLAVLCTYSLAACGANEILDAVRTHQFALARRQGNWVVIETAAVKRAKAEIKRLNEELERRVVERTSELMKTSEALRDAHTELAHVNRVTMMGQLAASISHEVVQPITAGVINAEAALRFLEAQPPDLEEVRRALAAAIEGGHRATDIIGRIRGLIKKAPPQKDPLQINQAILEVIALTRGEAVKNRVSVQTQLAEGLPLIQGDRVQLQQVVVNLIINAVEAMSVTEGSRELLLSTWKDDSGVLITVKDSGPGVPSENLERLFDAFYTTKPSGMGMGLPICRSIIEAHEGRIWASSTAGRGATIQFTLPVG